MINITNDMYQKLRVIDRLFAALDAQQLEQLAQTEEVVAKLKGKSEPTNSITSLVEEHNRMSNDLVTLRSDLQTLRYDLQYLVQAMYRPYDTSVINNMNSIKSKYGVY